MLSVMKSKRYSIIHLPLFAFFSKRLYWEIGRKWTGANLGYLFVLLAIFWIPPTLSLREQMLSSLQYSELHLLNQLPDINIKDGRVVMNQTEPLYLTRADGTPFAIIDTTGSMNYIDDDNVLALLTEEQLIVRRGKDSFNTLDLAQVSEFHVNKAIVSQWLGTTRDALAPLTYGTFLLLSYVFAVLALLLVAVLGLALSAAMNASLRFGAVMRIAVAAATPSIILMTTAAALGYPISAAVHAGVTISYLLLGIVACKSQGVEQEAPRLKLTTLLDEPVQVEADSESTAA